MFTCLCSYFYMYVFMCENKDDDDDDEMFKLANDVSKSYITWVTLQSPLLNRLGLSGLWGLRLKSFSLKLSSEVFAISCRTILAYSHDLDAVLFTMNLVVTYKC